MAASGSAEILETLGEGSFGVVYLARLTEGALQRTVVLKVLKSDWIDREEILTRARDEAVLLARLNHDNIVRVEQLTEIGGRPAVIMEHVQGLSLDRILRGQGPLPVAVAIAVASKIASALDAAYNRTPPGDASPLRVVHRDIKPSNIIISVSGAVKVLDFGTAHATFDAREARTSAITLGSPLYMAPECFDGADAHPTVDIYALGASLYEMLAGVPLGKLSVNPKRHIEKLNTRLGQLRTPELREENPVTKAVRNLIQRCMRYEPSKRPTAMDLRRLCMEFLRRMPRSASTLDQFAEVVVEPLYRKREVRPPIPLDGTMSISGPLRLGTSSEFSRRAEAMPPPRPLQPEPRLPPAPLPPPPLPVRTRQPSKAPIMVQQPPPPQREAGIGTILALGFVGLLAGVGFIVVVFLFAQFVSEGNNAEIVPQPAPELAAPDPAPVPDKEPSPVEATTTKAKDSTQETEEPRKEEGARVIEPKPEPEQTPEPTPTPPANRTPPPADPVGLKRTKTAVSYTVKVVSMPAGAEVVINGVRQRTPGTIDVLKGVNSAYITFPDGSSTSCSVEIGAGTSQLAFRQSGETITCP